MRQETPKGRTNSEGALGAIAALMPSEEEVSALADFFSAFADRTRLRIISALLATGELSVGQLARLAGTSESAASHQLKLLRLLRLITFRSAGRMSLYHLDDAHIGEILRAGLEHVGERA